MRAFRYVLLSVLLSAPSLRSQPKIFDVPLSPRIANYWIKAELHPERKMVNGKEILTWRNTSPEPVSTLQFHLYLNAFKNNRSTFMMESHGRQRQFKARTEPEDWGYINITSIGLLSGENLLPSLKFIHPDDDNAEDQTVAEVTLPRPVNPGEIVSVAIEFISKLPRVFARSGFADGNFFMVAQWFPKIGVYQWKPRERGKWNCHQYHANSEFFADFGVYDVEITVPQEFVVAANGILIGKRRPTPTSGTITYIYHQEDVHDFVWSADPRFVTWHEIFHNDSTGRDVDITLYTYRTHATYAPLILDVAKHAIAYFQEWYGVYPYRTLTIVDPPADAMGAGGMEYPTFFTTSTFWWLPKGVHLTALVTFHEFGHNYFQGMLASNEFEEAWLDEGMNSYAELKCMERYFGKDRAYMDFMGIKIDGVTQQRSSYIPDPDVDPVVMKSWLYAPGQYTPKSYSKPALLLRTLENILSSETMDRIMKTYFEKWKFKHPTTSDFIAVANQVSGQDLSWYFNQVLYGTGWLDYEVASVSTEPLRGELGYVTKGDSMKFLDHGEKQDKFRSIVQLRRKGSVVIPVDVLFVFDNGKRIVEQWDGKSEWKEYRFVDSAPLSYALVDPEQKLVLDVNFTNNSRRIHEERQGIWRTVLELMYRLQSFLQYLTFFS